MVLKKKELTNSNKLTVEDARQIQFRLFVKQLKKGTTLNDLENEIDIHCLTDGVELHYQMRTLFRDSNSGA